MAKIKNNPNSKSKDDFNKTLKAICDSTTTAKRESFIQKCTAIIKSHTKAFVENVVKSDEFSSTFENVLEFAFPPQFDEREYFTYERDDFKGIPEVTATVLDFILSILSALNARPAQSDSNTNLDSEVKHRIHKFLPKLMMILGANAKYTLWTFKKSGKVSSEVVSNILTLFSCETCNDLFALKVYETSNDGKAESLLEVSLNHLQEPLSKEQWCRNPFLCDSFCWIVLQINSPQFSAHIDQVMAVALNLLHDQQTGNKVKGLKIFSHLIKTASSEELRWFNRAEVVYQALKSQLYIKETPIMHGLLPSLLSVLKILEKSASMERHNAIFETLIRDAGMENLLSMRRVYISYINLFTRQMGVYCIRHLPPLIKLVESYLDIEDGPSDRARISALVLLSTVIEEAWPRISPHAECLTKSLLKVKADILSPSYQRTHSESVLSEMESANVKCLARLCVVQPQILPCLQIVHMSALHSVSRNLNIKI